MASIYYATREEVKRAVDSAETSRNNAQVDRALAAATPSIEGLCHRRFYPERKTVTFDWPTRQSPRSYRLWLDAHELVSVDTMTSGGVTIPAPDRFLYPASGPPYNRLEIDLDSSSAFSSGDTHQQSMAITGVYAGCPIVEEMAAATLAAAVVDTTGTSVTISASSTIGVGSILRVDDERMLVTGRSMSSTSQTLQAVLGDQAKNTAVTVSNGAAYAVDEVILCDAERMLITDIAGNTLVVKRAWDGTVLASHTGSTVYASRTLTVVRGALGTTAATHSNAAPVARYMPPPLVNQLAVAEACVALGLQSAGYARMVRMGEAGRNQSYDVEDLRERVYTAHGRKARSRAV